MYSKSSCRTFLMCYNNSSPGKRIFTTRNIMRKGNVFIRVCLFTGAGGSPCNHYLLSYWSVTGHMGIPPRPVPPKKDMGVRSALVPFPYLHGEPFYPDGDPSRPAKTCLLGIPPDLFKLDPYAAHTSIGKPEIERLSCAQLF